MKLSFKSVCLILPAIGLLAAGCSKKKFTSWNYIQDPAVAAQLKSFVAEKEAQADAATNDSEPEFAAYFAAAKKGDWPAMQSIFKNFRNHAGQYQHSGATDPALRGTRWQDIVEIWGALEAFADCNQEYAALYGSQIIQSIPPGSVYFGGTDPGRFVVTAMEKSQAGGDPFFGLTQNALADGTYLDYLRAMYGAKLYIPTPEDSQNCFNEYYQDVQTRMAEHKLDPGEKAAVGPDGKMQISGQVSVMKINGLLAKVIIDRNTNRDFYIEESFPLDWMYPYLEPHGLIFKINPEPLTELSDDDVQTDHDYWTKTIAPMIGDWLTQDTSVQEVAAFAQKVCLHHDFHGFKGDRAFVQNSYSQKMFSKERDSIAGLYAWRTDHPADASDKQSMDDAADFAFRQAWALCPYSPEAVYRYVGFLMKDGRYSDALIVAETAEKFRSAGAGQFSQLISQLRRSSTSEKR